MYIAMGCMLITPWAHQHMLSAQYLMKIMIIMGFVSHHQLLIASGVAHTCMQTHNHTDFLSFKKPGRYVIANVFLSIETEILNDHLWFSILRSLLCYCLYIPINITTYQWKLYHISE